MILSIMNKVSSQYSSKAITVNPVKRYNIVVNDNVKLLYFTLAAAGIDSLFRLETEGGQHLQKNMQAAVLHANITNNRRLSPFNMLSYKIYLWQDREPALYFANDPDFPWWATRYSLVNISQDDQQYYVAVSMKIVHGNCVEEQPLRIVSYWQRVLLAEQLYDVSIVERVKKVQNTDSETRLKYKVATFPNEWSMLGRCKQVARLQKKCKELVQLCSTGETTYTLPWSLQLSLPQLRPNLDIQMLSPSSGATTNIDSSLHWVDSVNTPKVGELSGLELIVWAMESAGVRATASDFEVADSVYLHFIVSSNRINCTNGTLHFKVYMWRKGCDTHFVRPDYEFKQAAESSRFVTLNGRSFNSAYSYTVRYDDVYKQNFPSNSANETLQILSLQMNWNTSCYMYQGQLLLFDNRYIYGGCDRDYFDRFYGTRRAVVRKLERDDCHLDIDLDVSELKRFVELWLYPDAHERDQ